RRSRPGSKPCGWRPRIGPPATSCSTPGASCLEAASDNPAKQPVASLSHRIIQHLPIFYATRVAIPWIILSKEAGRRGASALTRKRPTMAAHCEWPAALTQTPPNEPNRQDPDPQRPIGEGGVHSQNTPNELSCPPGAPHPMKMESACVILG